MSNNKHVPIVAYFDFDGTLTYKDTFFSFLRFSLGYIAIIKHLPSILFNVGKYLIRVQDNEKTKQNIVKILLTGYKKSDIHRHARDFALTKLNKYTKPEIYARLEWHREHGHTIFIVSANIGVFLRTWAKLHQIHHVVATELEFDATYGATGNLATPNCYGAQKVERVNKYLHDNKLDFEYAYAYGNSRGDYELLDFANEAFFVKGNTIKPWHGK